MPDHESEDLTIDKITKVSVKELHKGVHARFLKPTVGDVPQRSAQMADLLDAFNKEIDKVIRTAAGELVDPEAKGGAIADAAGLIADRLQYKWAAPERVN